MDLDPNQPVLTGECPLFEWGPNQEVENMDLERDDEIEDEDADILIINEERGGINIRDKVDEGNEESTGINDDIGAEEELEQANKEIDEEEKIIEDVINNNEADEEAVITDNKEDLSEEYKIENEERDNNNKSREISSEKNIETMAYDETQKSDWRNQP